MEYGVTGLTDISASLWQQEFRGVSDGKSWSDVNRVLSRAWDCGLEKIFIVGKSYKTSKQALEISRTDRRLYCTVGVHPSKYANFKRKGKKYADHLAGLIDYSKRKCVAVGNFGLDYTDEGLAVCEKKDQIKIFDWHVQFGHYLKKPMIFHYRGDAFDDMMTLLTKQHHHAGSLRGVCHSFKGPLVQARELIRKGFYIGLDGCSLKEKHNLEAGKGVPLNRLLLGTSSPSCSVLRPHAGLKYLANGFFPSKDHRFHNEIMFGRTEPSHMCQLLEIVATARRMELQELADILQMNVKKLFFAKNNKIPCECEHWPDKQYW